MRTTPSGILIPDGPPGAIPVWQDILERRPEIASRAWVMENAPEFIRRNLERGANRPWIENADGLNYRDTRQPFLLVTDVTGTLLSTSVLIHSAAYTALPAGYWWAGKKLKLTVWGAFTTGATPGNLTTEIRYGTASAGGTILATSAAVALAINKTSITCCLEAYITCRTLGATGAFMANGRFMPDQIAIILPAANTPQMIPASAPATVAIDTTSTVASFHGINFQMKRSGSTAETFITHDLTFEALN